MKTVVHIEDYKNALLTDSYRPKPWHFTFNSSLEVTLCNVWVFTEGRVLLFLKLLVDRDKCAHYEGLVSALFTKEMSANTHVMMILPSNLLFK